MWINYAKNSSFGILNYLGSICGMIGEALKSIAELLDSWMNCTLYASKRCTLSKLHILFKVKPRLNHQYGCSTPKPKH